MHASFSCCTSLCIPDHRSRATHHRRGGREFVQRGGLWNPENRERGRAVPGNRVPHFTGPPSFPLQLFRFHFPWLLVTIGAGTICAFLARAHEKTLQHTLVVAFFLTLVLALGESVAVQSLAIVLEAFRLRKVTLGWFLATCRREALTALPLAVAAGLVVFMVVLILDHALWPALIIGGSIAFAVGAACLLGISIPTLLHIAKLDLTIAAGPITLALTDIVTLLVYLGLTSVLLQ